MSNEKNKQNNMLQFCRKVLHISCMYVILNSAVSYTLQYCIICYIYKLLFTVESNLTKNYLYICFKIENKLFPEYLYCALKSVRKLFHKTLPIYHVPMARQDFATNGFAHRPPMLTDNFIDPYKFGVDSQLKLIQDWTIHILGVCSYSSLTLIR